MTGLRWTLGLVTAIVTAGLLALISVGSSFRRSFGASDNSPLIPFGAVLVAGLILASLAWPDRRPLLHVVAALMLAMGIGCAFLARVAPVVATLAFLFAAGWFLFYYRAVWR